MEADESWGFYGKVHVQGSLDDCHTTLPLADGLVVLRSAKNQFFHLGSCLGMIFDFG